MVKDKKCYFFGTQNFMLLAQIQFEKLSKHNFVMVFQKEIQNKVCKT